MIFCLLFSLLFSFFLSLYLIRVFLQFCLSQISSRCNIDLRKQKKKDVLHEHNHCTQHQSDHTILSYSNRTFIIWCTMGSVFTKGGGCLQDSGHLIAHKCHPASFFFFFFNALSLQGISYHISFCRLLFLYLWNARNCWAKIMECFPLALFMISNSSPFS